MRIFQRLNQDVCDLSTTCSKAELQLKLQEEEATKILKEWQETGQLPSEDILSKIVAAKHEVSTYNKHQLLCAEHLQLC